jgi:bifunctional ADP-heptose synthase (sugar kinase/adenylyltransferase)
MGLAVLRDRLIALVSGLPGHRLAVAGDYVLDRFVYGHPKRISREAPVLILRFWKEESLPGGAGNTRQHRGFGGVPLPVGVIGDDEAGRMLKQVLRTAASTRRGSSPPPSTRPIKTRILGERRTHQAADRACRPGGAPRGERGDHRAVVPPPRGAGRRASGAVLSDYGYGSVGRIPSRRFAARCRRRRPSSWTHATDCSTTGAPTR